MHVHARHHLFCTDKCKLWVKHLSFGDTDSKCSPQREITILGRNQCSIWGNICTARCHRTCYSTFLMLESATSGSGTHQSLCLHSILRADSSSIWSHSKPVRKHMASVMPNPRESAQMRKSVYENSQSSEQVSASLQKQLKIEQAHIFRKLPQQLVAEVMKFLFIHQYLSLKPFAAMTKDAFVKSQRSLTDRHLLSKSSLRKTHRS